MTDSFYRFQMSLLPVVQAMAERGLRVNDTLRQERLRALDEEAERLRAAAQPIAAACRVKLTRPALFETRRVCAGCRNGKKKRLTCAVCGGAGAFTRFAVNLASPQQLADLLYHGLRLPARSQGGRVTTDEEALESLLALDTSGLVAIALRFNKLTTMREIYERIAPAPDGKVRTVYNVAGTTTGRFSAAAAFYVPASTNLQNLPAAEAAKDPLFAVRECIVPDAGEVFLYADLSQAEARVSAALAEDWALLDRWQDPAFDLHRWTAAQVFGCAMGTVTPAQRFLGKKARHALNYGMGATKFWRTVNAAADMTGVSVTLAEAKAIWKAYHALHPNLDAVWWARVQRTLEARAPLVASHCGWAAPQWPRFDDAGQLDAESLRAAIAWEPQHTVVHRLNAGMRTLWAAEGGQGYRVLFQGHDSVLLGVDRHRWRSVAARAQAALEAPMQIRGYPLTIPAEVFVAHDNWATMERVR